MRLGLGLGLGGVRVLGTAEPVVYDPDAAAWFAATETAVGAAAFGPDAATQAANKGAWNNWILAQKAAASPIAGRSNWEALTAPDAGFVQPLMGLSTFNVPPLFGGRTFTGFVAGDHDPALGPRGGAEKVLIASNRFWDSAPLNDLSAGAWVTEAASVAGGRRLFGTGVNEPSTRILANTSTRCQTQANSLGGDTYNTGTFPRSAFVSRSNSAGYTLHNGTSIDVVELSAESAPGQVSFFATPERTLDTDLRLGLVFYGRSINLEAMYTACVALSAAIVWPT